MSFPTTPIIDAGNRNENPLSNGGKWSVAATYGGSVMIDDGTTIIASIAAFRGCSWNPSTFADCEMYATLNGTANASNNMILNARGSLAATSAYLVNSDGSVHLQRVDAGTYSVLATVAYTTVAGDKIGISCIGTTITAYLFKVSTGLWSVVGTVTDATYASGSLVIETNNSTSGTGFSNIGGGTPTSSVTRRPSVGPSISPSIAPSIGGR